MNEPNTKDTLIGALKALDSVSNSAIAPLPALGEAAVAGNAIAQALISLTTWLARSINLPFELLFRRNFGERYFSEWLLIGLGAALWGMWLGLRLDAQIAGSVFAFTWITMSIHGWIMYFRDRRGDYWHSYYEGDSRLRLGSVDQRLGKAFFTFDFSKIVLEPLIIFMLALFMSPMSNALFGREGYYSGWSEYFRSEYYAVSRCLMIAFVSFLGYQLYAWRYRKNALLDRKDAKLMAEVEAMADTPTTTEGIHHHKGVAYLAHPNKQEWGR